MKRPIQLMTFILFVIVALCVVRVSVENSISTTGMELSSLQKDLNSYNKANALLQEKYLKESSLTSLSVKAEKKGYVASQNQLHLSAPLPLALKQ